MIVYDQAYLTSLSRDMAKGDVDACAGFFAATYKEAIKTASRKLGDEYAVQDVIETLYRNMFLHSAQPKTGRVLLLAFRNKLNELCDAKKAELDASEDRVPLAPGRGVNNEESAELLLHYIFRSIGREPSHLPLSAFVAYNEYRTSRYTLQFASIIVALILLIAVPFVFRAPKLSIAANTENPWAPTYTLECESLLPVDSVSVKLNGKTVSATLQADDTYLITPTETGWMEVEVTLITKMSATIETTVVQVDYTAPTVIAAIANSDYLTVTLSDDASGLDLENAYALLPDGSQVAPESWDNESGVVTFARLDNNSNVYFPDQAGNILHVVCQYEE